MRFIFIFSTRMQNKKKVLKFILDNQKLIPLPPVFFFYHRDCVTVQEVGFQFTFKSNFSSYCFP